MGQGPRFWGPRWWSLCRRPSRCRTSVMVSCRRSCAKSTDPWRVAVAVALDVSGSLVVVVLGFLMGVSDCVRLRVAKAVASGVTAFLSGPCPLRPSAPLSAFPPVAVVAGFLFTASRVWKSSGFWMSGGWDSRTESMRFYENAFEGAETMRAGIHVRAAAERNVVVPGIEQRRSA